MLHVFEPCKRGTSSGCLTSSHAARNSNWSCFGDEATSAMCSRANSHMASCQSACRVPGRPSCPRAHAARSSCHVACSTSRASCRAASRAHSRPLRSSASCCCTSAEVWRVGTRFGGEISSDCTLAARRSTRRQSRQPHGSACWRPTARSSASALSPASAPALAPASAALAAQSVAGAPKAHPPWCAPQQIALCHRSPAAAAAQSRAPSSRACAAYAQHVRIFWPRIRATAGCLPLAKKQLIYWLARSRLELHRTTVCLRGSFGGGGGIRLAADDGESLSVGRFVSDEGPGPELDGDAGRAIGVDTASFVI